MNYASPLASHVGKSGFGKKLEAPPSVDEALAQSGLDWEVGIQDTFTKIDGEFVKTPARAIVRQDNNQILGSVKKGYHLVQNRAAFEVLTPFIEKGELELEAGGSISDGKKIWALARITGDPVEIVKDDPIYNYVLLSNSHDGSSSVRFGFTNMRVVCCNMLHAGSAHSDEFSKLLRIRHTKGAQVALEEAADAMNLAKRSFEASVAQYKVMAAKGIHKGDLEKFVQRVFKPELIKGGKWDDVHEADFKKKVDTWVAKIAPHIEDKTNTLPGVGGTVWGMYNAMTHHLTHEYGRTEDSRINNLVFDSAGYNHRAVQAALSLAAA